LSAEDRPLPTARRPDGAASTHEVAWRRDGDDGFALNHHVPDDAAEILILSPRSTRGYREALTTSGALRARVGGDASIEVRRTPFTIPEASFAEHVETLALAAGEQPSADSALDRMELVDAASLLGEERSAVEILRERSGLIDRFLDTEPPPIEWVVEGLIPAGVEGGIVAAGGTGKGLFEVLLAIHICLGVDCGPFAVPAARGVLLLALEDDVDALHRRVRATLVAHFPHLDEDQRALLRRHLEVKPLRGAQGASLRDDFVDAVIDAARSIPDIGIIFLDPLARGLALPEGKDLNSQEGGGVTMNQLGRIAQATGASVIYAHHVNKQSRRDGSELQATAATGSMQLVDLSRVVINMRALTPREAEAYGLEHRNGTREFVELRVSKTNGPRPTGGPFVLEVLPTGAVEWREEARGQELTDLERVLEIVQRLHEETGEPVPIETISANRGTLGENRAQAAWNELERSGVLTRRRRAVQVTDADSAVRRVDGLEPAEDAVVLLASLVGRDGDDGAL
jgi:regulatory protein RepA